MTNGSVAVQEGKFDEARDGQSVWRAHFAFWITFLQVFTDLLAVFCSYLASYYVYTGFLSRGSPQTLGQFSIIAVVAAILYLFLLEREGLYRREMSLLNVKELRGIFHVSLYAAAIMLSATFYIRSTSFSRITITLALALTPMILYIERQFFYRLHVLFHQRGWSRTRVLVYGAGTIGTHLAKRLFQSPSLGLFPLGFLDDDESKYGNVFHWKSSSCPKKGVKVIGGEEILRRARKHGVEMVLIALPSATFERNQKLVELCIENGLDYAIVPNAYEEFIQRIQVDEIGGIPLLRRRVRKPPFYYLILKRFIDFVLSSFFVFLLSPLVIILGIAIKLESKGPFLFKQKRVGLRGKEFTLYKFRSMHVEAPKYAQTPTESNDPRITKVGRWLRRTSLDELPQLFNVWRGDMSLVGPRPEMPFIVETYTPLHRQRLDAKPGITGVWQISAVRGEPIHSNIEYDLFYLENRSILLDVAIIIKTILSVIRGIGAV